MINGNWNVQVDNTMWSCGSLREAMEMVGVTVSGLKEGQLSFRNKPTIIFAIDNGRIKTYRPSELVDLFERVMCGMTLVDHDAMSEYWVHMAFPVNSARQEGWAEALKNCR